MTNPPRAAEILLIEDNPADILLTREAFEEFKVTNNLHVMENGEAAMAFLYREGIYADAPRPDLILLDLNLPRKSGREVLSEIKADPQLKYIPVIVLTTSQSENDVLHSYGDGASCYIVKPVGFQNFSLAIRKIHSFWFQLVVFPPKVENGKETDQGLTD
jgi:CheY-like chemotaxis protein